MKRLFYIIIFSLAPLYVFSQSYTVDSSKSNLEWIGKKTTGSHNGTLLIKDGFIKLDKKNIIIEGEFTLDMESITCTDLEGSKKGYFEDHLKNEDFFNTKEHPLALFRITNATSKKINGTLTIKGISQEISFNYTQINAQEYKADITIDRTLFDIKYKSKSIFKDLGDNFIYDDFTVKLNSIIFK